MNDGGSYAKPSRAGALTPGMFQVAPNKRLDE
jgi:hypothetical protein